MVLQPITLVSSQRGLRSLDCCSPPPGTSP